MEDSLMRQLIEKRCRRTITVILSSKERDLDGYLPDDVGAAYRKVVLDAVNDFHNFVLDILKSVDDGSVTLNDHYLRKIDEIYEAISGERG